MSLFSEHFLVEAVLGLASSLFVTGIWSIFVWINNQYVIRRGGDLLKYGAC